MLAGLLAAGGPSLATWREDTRVLRVGYLATGNPAADASRMEPFRAYLEARIALPVELVPATTYAGLIDGTADGRIQYAILSATAFAALEAVCTCVEPLAVPSAYDGSLGFHSILLARADGPIASLADARDARLALAGEDSVAGRLVPMEALAAEGIDVATYFADVVTAPGPEAAIASLLLGDAEVAVGWSSLKGDPATGFSFGVLTRMVIDGRVAMDRVRVIWQSPLIPFGPHIVRTDVASELKLLLADALFDMASAAPDVLATVDRTGFGGGGFVAIDPADYAIVGQLLALQEPAP
jgi:phosphonate transport system substrate-binding protein